MEFNPVKIRPPGKIHGGKAYLARRFIKRAPRNARRVREHCGGMASFLLNVRPVPGTPLVYNEISPLLINMYRAIKETPSELLSRLRGLKYDLKTFEHWRDTQLDPSQQLEIAIKAIVSYRMSRGGLRKSFAWSERKRGGQPGDLNAWMTMLESWPMIANHVKNWTITERDFLQSIADEPLETDVNYIDPTYLRKSRATFNNYEFEMTEKQHEDMLRLVTATPGYFMISHYAHEMYDDMLKGWRRVQFDMPNHSGQGKAKQRRVECLYLNYGQQLQLFPDAGDIDKETA